MKVTVLTTTSDRPLAFALAERMMARQNRQPDEWIVADGGATRANCNLGQIQIHEPRPAGVLNFATNLLNGIARARGDLLVMWEDDDWYAPNHIELLERVAAARPIVGAEPIQYYHNVARRCWKRWDNIGASMCQTAIRSDLFVHFEAMVRSCLAANSYGIDTRLWKSIPRDKWGMAGRMTVIGMKGLPGQTGLGVGHRPDGRWKPDPLLHQLRRWIGADAGWYEGFVARREAA